MVSILYEAAGPYEVVPHSMVQGKLCRKMVGMGLLEPSGGGHRGYVTTEAGDRALIEHGTNAAHVETGRASLGERHAGGGSGRVHGTA